MNKALRADLFQSSVNDGLIDHPDLYGLHNGTIVIKESRRLPDTELARDR